MVVMQKLVDELWHAGPAFDAIGVTVKALIVTFTVEAGEVPQVAVAAVTLYVPAPAEVTLVITGFCALEVKPFGPVHE